VSQVKKVNNKLVSLGVLLLFILNIVVPFSGSLTQASAATATITNPSPQDNATNQLTRPTLSATVTYSGTMRVVFSEYEGGVWTTIREFNNVASGTYSTVPNLMVDIGTTYQWRVDVYDGATLSTSQTYTLTTTSTVLTPKWTYRSTAGSEAGVDR